MSKHTWQVIVGIDDYSVVCLASKPLAMGKGQARDSMRNFLSFIKQMDGLGNHPGYVKLTTDGSTFNLFVKARRPLTDYFNGNKAAQVLAGIFYLR